MHLIILLPVALPFFPHYLINGTKAGKKLLTINLCSNIFYNFCLNYFSLRDEVSEILSKMYISIHINCRLSWSDFNETWFFRQIFEKSPNIKFHENPSRGSQFFPCGWTEGQTNGWTDTLKGGRTKMRTLTVAFHNFGKPPKSVAITLDSEHALFRAIQ